MPRIETQKFGPFGPHSESQVISDIDADTTVVLRFYPSEEYGCYLVSHCYFAGSDVDVFEITADHPDMHKHTVTINEGILDFPFEFERIIPLTPEKVLTLQVHNTDTANAHRFELVVPYFFRTKWDAEEMERSAIEEIREPLRKR